MEITNEIKAKVFAQYFEQPVVGKDKNGILIDYHFSGSFLSDDEILKTMQLWLKPLYAITDEDAIEISNILKNLNTAYAHTFDKRPENIKMYPLVYATKHIHTCQFLQSKGYDLPQYLLGGKTLHEAGLAIYE